MEDRFNTIAGWTLGAAIVALGSSLFVGELFHHEPVEKDGYEVASADPSGGGAETEKPIDFSVADPVKGKELFSNCQTCHTINAGGANGTGPNLYGIVGKAVASTAGFDYSPALKAKGGKWDFAALDQWLLSPRKYVDGTKMGFAGMADPVKRANLIAYLNTEGSNLPLPAAPAPAKADAAPAADAAASNAAAPAANAAEPAANAAAPSK